MERGKKTVWELYLYLLQCGIQNTRIEKDRLAQYDRVDSDELAEISIKQSQQLLLYWHVKAYDNYCKGIEPFYQENTSEYFFRRTMQEYAKYKMLRDVVAKAAERDCCLLVFKGPVLAALYPQYTLRLSSDTDFWVDRESKETAVQLLLELGYEYTDHSKNEVTVMHHAVYGHTVELHTSLWEDFHGRRIDILDSYGLTGEASRIEIEACGMKLQTLGYEEHLIYQMFHIIKHFSLEGVGCRYLADITLYINQYGEQIDYPDFWSKMEQLGYHSFCEVFFSICITYLGMCADIMEGHRAVEAQALHQLITDLMQVGSRNDGRDANWQILGAMTPYFVGDKKSQKTGFGRKCQVLFLRSRDLPENLAYAKKYPVLLPVAWIHRILRYLLRLRGHQEDWYHPNEKLAVVDDRIRLMESMGLLDE